MSTEIERVVLDSGGALDGVKPVQAAGASGLLHVDWDVQELERYVVTHPEGFVVFERTVKVPVPGHYEWKTTRYLTSVRHISCLKTTTSRKE